MINVSIVSVAQSVELSSGRMDNIVVLRFFDGTECNAVVTESVVDRVIKLANGGKAPDLGPAPVKGAVVDEKVVEWATLSDQELSLELKGALRYLNVPPKLTRTAIVNLISQVNDRFGEEEWAEVQQRYLDTAADSLMPQQRDNLVLEPVLQAEPTPRLQPARALGKIQWVDGSPIVPGQARALTVPANEAGWPIVPGRAVDVGELVSSEGDVDEDGVGQL